MSGARLGARDRAVEEGEGLEGDSAIPAPIADEGVEVALVDAGGDSELMGGRFAEAFSDFTHDFDLQVCELVLELFMLGDEFIDAAAVGAGHGGGLSERSSMATV